MTGSPPTAPPLSPVTRAIKRSVAAHHEAGHAVATVMRGAGELLTVGLHPDRHGEGITWSRIKPADAAFVAYAGPWAEARHLWGDRDLDDEDEDGIDFDGYVFGALLEQPGDFAVATRGPLRGEYALATERVWHGELNRHWRAIQAVACRLERGVTVTDADVRAAVDAHAYAVEEPA